MMVLCFQIQTYQEEMTNLEKELREEMEMVRKQKDEEAQILLQEAQDTIKKLSGNLYGRWLVTTYSTDTPLNVKPREGGFWQTNIAVRIPTHYIHASVRNPFPWNNISTIFDVRIVAESITSKYSCQYLLHSV